MKTASVGRLMPPVRHFRSVDDAKRYGTETVLCGFTLPLSLTPVSFLSYLGGQVNVPAARTLPKSFSVCVKIMFKACGLARRGHR
jgi:hypothetical protein